jgi:hypothetical protein
MLPEGPFPPPEKKFLGTAPPRNVFRKGEVFFRARLEFNPDVAVLAVAAGLLFMLAFHLDLAPDGFPVRHARLFERRPRRIVPELGRNDVERVSPRPAISCWRFSLLISS